MSGVSAYNPGRMHFYLFVRCKTPRCLCKWYVAHQELPTADPASIDYPSEWFPIEVQCGRCQQKSEYAEREIQKESSHRAIHPDGWRPLFPAPPRAEAIN